MKKLFAPLFALVMCLSLTACGSSGVSQTTYDALQGKYDRLQGKYDRLQEKYDNLEESYNTLQDEYNSLVTTGVAVSDPSSELSTMYAEAAGGALSIGQDVDSIIQMLGEPDSIDGDSYYWTDSTTENSALSIDFENGVAYMLTVLNSEKYHIYGGIKVGNSLDDVAEILGSPTLEDENIIYYLFDQNWNSVNSDYDSDTVNAISFLHDGDTVSAIMLIQVGGSMDDQPGDGSDTTLSEPTHAGPHYDITYQNYHLYKNSDGDVRDYVLVQVQNTGTVDLYLGGASFDFEDADGHLAGTDSGLISSDPEIIAPGEYGYFYSNMGSVSGSDIDIDTEYTLVPNLKVEEAKHDIIRYEITDTTISEGKYGPVSIIGRITNNTDEDARMVWVAIVLFDENDTPLGVYGTNVMDLSAGSTQSFDADAIYLSNLDFTLKDVARYEVYACKTQYQF